MLIIVCRNLALALKGMSKVAVGRLGCVLLFMKHLSDGLLDRKLSGLVESVTLLSLNLFQNCLCLVVNL